MKRLLIAMLAVLLLQCHGTKDHAHWSYSGHGGPDKWGELQDDFKLCSTGKNQSPIDIQPLMARPTGASDIMIQYQPTAMKTLNNGHTVQLNNSAPSVAVIAGQKYELLQLHFHAPSEHKINGRSYPLEVHLVHRNAGGGLAVIGVLFEEGTASAALESLLQSFPDAAGQEKDLAATFQPATLLPAQTGYYRYSGSLTTPPCSEGVLWSVARRTVTASPEQLSRFRKQFYNGNARPVQPMQGRILESKM